MIYLIDDKVKRQKDYGWNEFKINSFAELLVAISNSIQLESCGPLESLFSGENIILVHESFFKNIYGRSGNNIRNELTHFAKSSTKSKLIFFSGSYNSRELTASAGSMPVSILYQNLGHFLNSYKTEGGANLKLLFYGENPGIENDLLQKREKSNTDLIANLNSGQLTGKGKNLLIHGNSDGFPLRLNNSANHLIFNKSVSDADFDKRIKELLIEEEFDRLFIPLCFGSSLSDYNGLRLAAHIRCTQTRNQCKPIFIYSIVKYSYLINNEYFDILKTTNVSLIGYSKSSFEKALEADLPSITLSDLSNEMKKLNLKVPADYEDSHSIANEWAIYRWSKTIGEFNETIETIDRKFDTNLYLKWLRAIHPIRSINQINRGNLKLTLNSTPTILYVDDEGDKGWGDIFGKILIDINNLDLVQLDSEFNDRSREEIVQKTFDVMLNEKCDIVVLDLRLHPDDFESSRIDDITGYKILKLIKEFNKGIQVIIFSATNKTWHLQALQNAGADGFVVKEGPEQNRDSDFTANSILHLKSLIQSSIDKVFLKKVYDELKPLRKKVDVNLSLNPREFRLNVPQLDLLLIKNYLNAADTLLYNHPKQLKYSYLQLILIIEKLVKSFYTNSGLDHVVKVGTKTQVCVKNRRTEIVLGLTPSEGWYNDTPITLTNLDQSFSKYDVAGKYILFNYRLACVLYFGYDQDLIKCSKFQQLYPLRSKAVAHDGEKSVEVDDILSALELLDILIA